MSRSWIFRRVVWVTNARPWSSNEIDTGSGTLIEPLHFRNLSTDDGRSSEADFPLGTPWASTSVPFKACPNETTSKRRNWLCDDPIRIFFNCRYNRGIWKGSLSANWYIVDHRNWEQHSIHTEIHGRTNGLILVLELKRYSRGTTKPTDHKAKRRLNDRNPSDYTNQRFLARTFNCNSNRALLVSAFKRFKC